MPGTRYDHVRAFTENGWRVLRVGPKGGHTTVAVYETEEAAAEVAEVLNRLIQFEK